MDKNNEYVTKDLYEAAFLSASGQKLKALERTGGPPYWFVFSDRKTCGELSNNYWNGEATVKAKAYADALRTLKDRLFAQNRDGYGDRNGKHTE